MSSGSDYGRNYIKTDAFSVSGENMKRLSVEVEQLSSRAKRPVLFCALDLQGLQKIPSIF
jgi:hypothetical protein